MAVFGDLEWKSFLVAHPLWAIFTISFVFIFVRKLQLIFEKLNRTLKFFHWILACLIEITVPEVERRADGGKGPVIVKYCILKSFKIGVVLSCQSNLKIKRISNWYSLVLFTIHDAFKAASVLTSLFVVIWRGF